MVNPTFNDLLVLKQDFEALKARYVALVSIELGNARSFDWLFRNLNTCIGEESTKS